MGMEMEMEQNLEPKKDTGDNTGKLSAELIFSYWIFAWFLVYFFLDAVASRIGKASYTKWMHDNLNPIIALVIAFLVNMSSFFYMVYLNVGGIILLKYLTMVFFVKVIPIYCIRNYPVRLFENLLAILILLIIYLIYLYTQEETVSSVYTRAFNATKVGSNKTPFSSFVNSILGFLRL